MSDQSDLFEGRARRDAAIEAVEVPRPEWVALALEKIRLIPSEQSFTTDRIWPQMPPTDEPRVMGAVMRKAVAAGLCVSTQTYKQSVRPTCHARPILIWRRL